MLFFIASRNCLMNLRFTLDDLIKSFITEVVNNYASVPVLITDGNKKNIIASGNIPDSRRLMELKILISFN
jgi:hypothetical protein